MAITRMYRAKLHVLIQVMVITRIKACTLNCEDLCACVGPEGLGSDCSGFMGCHEKCPAESQAIGCNVVKGKTHTHTHTYIYIYI